MNVISSPTRTGSTIDLAAVEPLLRVGITTFGADGPSPGIGHYVASLLPHLAAVGLAQTGEVLAHQDEAEFFASGITVVPFSNRLRPPVVNLAWHQAALPSWCRRRGYDALFLPAANQRVPVSVPCPTVGATLIAFRRGVANPRRRFKRLIMRPMVPHSDVIRVAYEYSPDVGTFFEIASGDHWDDPDYLPEAETAHLADRDYIARADLAQIRSMLTACVRGEQFCDGWWDKVLRDGSVVALLDTLAVLKDQMDPGR